MTVETPTATAARASAIAIPDRHSRPRCRDGGRAAGPGAHRLDLRVRQRWRVDPLLVGLRGGCGTRRLAGPLALPGPRGRPARGPVAQPEPGSRHREDRRRPRNGGVRRHSAGRRARMEALAHPTARGRRDPARLASRRCGRLGVRPELQHPGVDDRLDGLRPRSRRSGVPAALGARSGLGAGRTARARRCRGRAVVPIALREPRGLLRGRLLGRSDDRHAHRLRPRARRARRGAGTAERLGPGDDADPRRGHGHLEGGRPGIQHVQLGEALGVGGRRAGSAPPGHRTARVRELSIGRQPVRGVVVRRCLHVRRVRPARGPDARRRALHGRLAGQRPSAAHRLGSAGVALRRGRGRRQPCRAALRAHAADSVAAVSGVRAASSA